MADSFDTIVVGVGAMGSAACAHLARRGQRVLGLERHGIPNSMGSSHGDSRAMRCAYAEHADYVPLLRRSRVLWGELQAEAGVELFDPCGVLYMGRAEGDLVGGTIGAAEMHGVTHERIDETSLAKRWPMFRPRPDDIGVFEPEAGLVIPERCIAAHANVALNHGASLRGHEWMESWTADDTGVTVHTREGTYHAAHLLICAGAWAASILAELGCGLTSTRQTLVWTTPLEAGSWSSEIPVWAFDLDDGRLLYGFPVRPERPGLKAAVHTPGVASDPDTLTREWRPEDEREVRDLLAVHFPAANGELLTMATCLYTNSPDTHFIVDRHPEHATVTVATGFSGHGFKFAAVMGEVLADLATDGETRHPIDFLRLARFG